ncbi:hypothetical protein BD410DRAFT_586527 [Rickenella mellea]|uniref:Uncharacterized protein n=1 Tax=Rickenella mellea TaxID=50990 RepID=A0A4Y7PPL5_9AGAM|nr:hypothetical protein BD410DRAFT_586527 [Rickenella mellea]
MHQYLRVVLDGMDSRKVPPRSDRECNPYSFSETLRYAYLSTAFLLHLPVSLCSFRAVPSFVPQAAVSLPLLKYVDVATVDHRSMSIHAWNLPSITYINVGDISDGDLLQLLETNRTLTSIRTNDPRRSTLSIAVAYPLEEFSYHAALPVVHRLDVRPTKSNPSIPLHTVRAVYPCRHT